jgi:hypothetical protein
MALSPTAAFADDGRDADGLLFRISGDVYVPPGQTVGSVVVIDGNATIDGRIKNSLTVVSGNAVITGSVGGSVNVISGTLDLRDGSTVEEVNTVDSELLRADGATVNGKIHQREEFEFPVAIAAAVSVLFWLSMTVSVVVAGLLFAAIGGRQLREASQTLTGDAVNTIIGVVMLWVAVPIVAVLAMLTLVGIPLGLGVLAFLLPVLWFLGYIVTGTWLGSLILRGSGSGGHPFAASALGLLLLQIAVLVPFMGVLLALLAGVWGAGALAYLAYRAAGGKGFSTPSQQPGTQPATAP